MPEPIRIRMGGYGPAGTGFSRALKLIGDRLIAQLGDRVEVKYVWNIMDLGYRAEDILWRRTRLGLHVGREVEARVGAWLAGARAPARAAATGA